MQVHIYAYINLIQQENGMHSVSDTSDKIHEATECSEYEER